MRKNNSEAKLSSSDDFIDVNLEEIRATDEAVEARRAEVPWFNPNYPLYFPETLSDTGTSERCDAIKRFSAEKWCDALGSLTFASHIIPLDESAIRFLLSDSPTDNSDSLDQLKRVEKNLRLGAHKYTRYS